MPRMTRDWNTGESQQVDDSDLSPSNSSTQFSGGEEKVENGFAHGMPHKLPFSPPPGHPASMQSVKTPAERVREKSLLDDPLALVVSPSCVQCKMCQKKIKLSAKSAYDTFHWRNHRARCLRTRKAKAKKPCAAPRLLAPPTPPPRRPATPSPHVVFKSSFEDMPPLVHSESEEEARSELSIEAQSPSSLTTIPLAIALCPTQATPVISSDPVIDDYMLRSHPECTQTSKVVAPGDHGRNWSWKQLRQPRFAPPVYYDDDDDDDDLEDEEKAPHWRKPSAVVDSEREHEAVRILSMLYHSR